MGSRKGQLTDAASSAAAATVITIDVSALFTDAEKGQVILDSIGASNDANDPIEVVVNQAGGAGDVITFYAHVVGAVYPKILLPGGDGDITITANRISGTGTTSVWFVGRTN